MLLGHAKCVDNMCMTVKDDQTTQQYASAEDDVQAITPRSQKTHTTFLPCWTFNVDTAQQWKYVETAAQ